MSWTDKYRARPGLFGWFLLQWDVLVLRWTMRRDRDRIRRIYRDYGNP